MQFYIPKNELLKKYIEGYYFISDDQKLGTEKYWTFPNNYFILTTNLNSKVKLGENTISITPSKIQNIYSSYVYRYISPIEVFYEKPINEITIYFKPLGINNFINDPEALFSQTKIKKFTAPFRDFETKMFEVFKTPDRQLQIEKLENYWLSKLTENDFTQIRKILTDVESDLKIEEVAQKNRLSRKHLCQLFKKHLGKSPSEYRKIYRFRNALNNMKHLKNLTELSYENLLYDQSHLIKDFKSLTSINPRAFFKNVDTNNKNVWLFI